MLTKEQLKVALDEADEQKLPEGHYWPWVAERLGVSADEVLECFGKNVFYFFPDVDPVSEPPPIS